MRTSLYAKLALSFMLVAFTTAALVALFIRLTSADRLIQLLIDQQRSSLETSLAEYYQANGGWSQVSEHWGQIQRQAQPTLQAQAGARPSTGGLSVTGQQTQAGTGGGLVAGGAQAAASGPELHGRPSQFGLADARGLVLVAAGRTYPVGTQLSEDVLKNEAAIKVGGVQVGTILTAAQQPGFNPAESLFLQRTNQALIMAMLGALVVALLLGIALASTITRPLRALTDAARGIGRGQLGQQVTVRSSDEIGQLASAFNRMSEEVATANRLRRRMTADIAHDLRTPLTVIAGYVESMRDGVLQPTPARLTLIYTEIERLQNLVGDLRMLSQADAGELPLNLQRIAPRSLLNRAATLFRHQAEQQVVTLQVATAPDLPDILVDEARMIQVLGNLLCNSLRYTAPGGRIELSAVPVNGRIQLTVRDNGSGIAPEELPFIFDRFYRADRARTDTGESGLGLAIVKALVESQAGSVSVRSTLGDGTEIRLDLPVCEPAA
jgi:signal transduction histidine kinase